MNFAAEDREENFLSFPFSSLTIIKELTNKSISFTLFFSVYSLSLTYDSISLGLNIFIYINFFILYQMEYENMRVPEVKALARDHGFRNYSWMRRAELVALLQNNPPPPPQMST